jgi:ABC-type nitrate/sulfonate/bicarbonate transport system substrate-binding protein
LQRVRQILFVKPAPLVWAERLDAFAAAGVEVETTQTLSSDQIGQGLAQGTWDFGIGVMDNVIAWNAERGAELQILAQLERSTVMRFCARAESLQEAAQEPIAVDSTTNGFVLVLYRALARAGLDWRSGHYDAVGGVRHRFEALVSGRASASILIPPFDQLAVEQGFSVLWDGKDIAPAYPGVVVTARRRWIEENAEAATRYLQALVLANRWAGRPENEAEAREVLRGARYSEEAAARLVRDRVPDLEPSREGWNETVALRRECAVLPDPEPAEATVINTDPLAYAAGR